VQAINKMNVLITHDILFHSCDHDATYHKWLFSIIAESLSGCTSSVHFIDEVLSSETRALLPKDP
jgi:hypothetical protein